jgi:hypothetical protein
MKVDEWIVVAAGERGNVEELQTVGSVWSVAETVLDTFVCV